MVHVIVVCVVIDTFLFLWSFGFPLSCLDSIFPHGLGSCNLQAEQLTI